MAIKDLQARQGQVDLIAEVIEKGDVRTFNKFGKEGRVCNVKIKDETGEMALTLWNEQIEQVKVSDKVHITNGWVGEWQGEKQLTTGKFGKLEVVEGGSKTKDEAETPNKEEIEGDEGEEISNEDEQLDEDVIKDEEEIK